MGPSRERKPTDSWLVTQKILSSELGTDDVKNNSSTSIVLFFVTHNSTANSLSSSEAWKCVSALKVPKEVSGCQRRRWWEDPHVDPSINALLSYDSPCLRSFWSAAASRTLQALTTWYNFEYKHHEVCCSFGFPCRTCCIIRYGNTNNRFPLEMTREQTWVLEP